jgi:hypothetical protein
VDPELARKIRSGDYVVDAQATAAAILSRGGFDALEPSDVLVARELDDVPAGADELESLPTDDLT